MESPLFLFDKAMERFLVIKEKLLPTGQAGVFLCIIGSGKYFEGPGPKAFYFPADNGVCFILFRELSL